MVLIAGGFIQDQGKSGGGSALSWGYLWTNGSFCGRDAWIWETKGLDRLTATARSLPAGIRLVIVGDGPARAWLVTQLETLDDRPLLMGNIKDPAEIFGIADAFLFTSNVEPFGLVLLEAAASGLPIYAFVCEGGGRELLRDLGATVVMDSSVSDSALRSWQHTKTLTPPVLSESIAIIRGPPWPGRFCRPIQNSGELRKGGRKPAWLL